MKRTLLTALLALVACNPAPTGLGEISAEALLADPPAGAVILDVRTAQEFASGHVPNAINIPHDQLASRIAELQADPTMPVVVYCERGGRAGVAADVLSEAGYANVLHLTGDMSGWREGGHPSETP